MKEGREEGEKEEKKERRKEGWKEGGMDGGRRGTKKESRGNICAGDTFLESQISVEQKPHLHIAVFLIMNAKNFFKQEKNFTQQ